jgi:hypothetical protein
MVVPFLKLFTTFFRTIFSKWIFNQILATSFPTQRISHFVKSIKLPYVHYIPSRHTEMIIKFTLFSDRRKKIHTVINFVTLLIISEISYFPHSLKIMNDNINSIINRDILSNCEILSFNLLEQFKSDSIAERI